MFRTFSGTPVSLPEKKKFQPRNTSSTVNDRSGSGCLVSGLQRFRPGSYFMVQAYNKLSRTHCLAIHKAFQRDTSRYAHELESGGTVVKFPYRKADFGTKRDVTNVTSLVSATLPVAPLNSLVM